MKKKNAVAAYFQGFGTKQLGEILMVLGAIALVVALFLTDYVQADTVLIAVSCGVLVLAFLLSLVIPVTKLFSKKINHRSPEYKGAIVATAVGAVLFALSVVGLIVALLDLVG